MLKHELPISAAKTSIPVQVLSVKLTVVFFMVLDSWLVLLCLSTSLAAILGGRTTVVMVSTAAVA